ncbi:phage tail protein [Enterobacter asburiae]|uniref:phage tail protein n=1 Tax=Enterobacter asburiae TaxID=61645 RepID=UPI001FFEB675|nr:phage tail protein [Enterobacter asburiae]MCK2177888.1 phage tail protein [Enterobacter asburiae]
MAIEIFNWRTQIQAGTEGEFTYVTRSASFGDGFEQIAGEGINPEKQSWPMTLTGKKAEMLDALSFCRKHITKSFIWTSPVGETGLYRIEAASINQSFTLTAYVFAIFPQKLPAWGFAIWNATGKLVLTNESRVLSDLQTVGDAGANGGINIDQTLSGSWAVAPAQLGQTIITNNATKPPTIYTINAYSSCRFNGGSTRINAGGTSTGTGSPGGGTNTGTSLTAINTAAYD